MSTDSLPRENMRFQPEADSIFDGQPQFGNGARRIRPDAVVDQRGDMILVLEARHGVVRLLLQEGAGDAPGFLRLEQRQAAAMDQIVDAAPR